MKYILDLDHTLLDTDAFATAVAKAGDGAHLVTATIWEKYQAQDFLYSDVLSWLQKKAASDVTILTAYTPALGPEAEAFQRAKVANTGLQQHVASVVMMEGLKGDYAAEIAKQFPPEEIVVFVDDRIEQCLSVQSKLPSAVCCRMIRTHPESIQNGEHKGIYVVHSLSDVDGIIASL